MNASLSVFGMGTGFSEVPMAVLSRQLHCSHSFCLQYLSERYNACRPGVPEVGIRAPATCVKKEKPPPNIKFSGGVYTY